MALVAAGSGACLLPVPVRADDFSDCLRDVTYAGRVEYAEAESYCKNPELKSTRAQYVACLKILSPVESAANWGDRAASCSSEAVRADAKGFLACSLQLTAIPISDTAFIHKTCSDAGLRRELGGSHGYANLADCWRAVTQTRLLTKSEAAERCIQRDNRKDPDGFAVCVKSFREAGLVQDYLLGEECSKPEVRREAVAVAACIRKGKSQGLIGEKADFNAQSDYLKFCEMDARRRPGA